jgi:flagellar motor switch protein FliM
VDGHIMENEDEDLSADWGVALAEQKGEEMDDLAAEWGAALGEQGVENADEVAAQWAALMDDNDTDLSDTSRGADRVLNQEEIDNLLGFNLDGHIASDQSGIRALVNSALVSYERLPMLEIVFDRLVRETTTSLRNFTSDNVEVSLDSISSVRFGDYLNSIPLPAILAVFKCEQWDNYGLVTVDSSLIYSIIDVLLGGGRGTSAIRVEGRPYTTIEMNLVRRMIEILLADAEKAFAPLTQIKFTLERLETNPRFAPISRPANACILTQFRVDMEDRGGKIEMLLPYATIEPIRNLLIQMIMGEKFGRDNIWEGHLASEIYNAEIEVDAVMCDEELPLSMVLDLSVGQTLLFNVSPSDPVAIKCGPINLTAGNIGRLGENVSVKINRPLRRSRMTLAAFERAVQKEMEKT